MKEIALVPRSEAPGVSLTPISLPHVSIVVVNYNYGRYLNEAVCSVFSQTYKNLECIVVDNGSTDESDIVLKRLESQFPSLRVVREKKNSGQSVASQVGFEASNGDYVAFLDADDMLLPNFVETHILVHLSVKRSVGVTSADMLQLGGTGIVAGSDQGIRKAVAVRVADETQTRPFDEVCPTHWPYASRAREFSKSVFYVKPLDVDWAWSATSGNMYRRDALRPFLHKANLSTLMSNTDAFLLRGVSGLCGSVLIDLPLAIYRIHGGNVFTKHPPLDCVLAFDGRGASVNEQCLKLLLSHLMQEAEFFAGWVYDPVHLMNLMNAVEQQSKTRGHLAELLAANIDRVWKLFGFWNGTRWMLQEGVSVFKLLKRNK